MSSHNVVCVCVCDWQGDINPCHIVDIEIDSIDDINNGLQTFLDQ